MKDVYDVIARRVGCTRKFAKTHTAIFFYHMNPISIWYIMAHLRLYVSMDKAMQEIQSLNKKPL